MVDSTVLRLWMARLAPGWRGVAQLCVLARSRAEHATLAASLICLPRATLAVAGLCLPSFGYRVARRESASPCIR